MQILLLLIGLLIVAGASAAAPVRFTAAEAELVADRATIVPGTTLDLGLRLKLDPDWHVYWKNAGDSGSPPSLTLELPEGFAAGPLEFGVPARIPIAHLVNYGYEGEVLFPVRVTAPPQVAGPVTIRARADWLECKESCLPASAELTITFPDAPVATALFEATRAKLPTALPAGASATASAAADAVALTITGIADCSTPDFFPDREGHFAHARITRREALEFTLPLETNARAPDTLTGVLVCGGARGFEVAASTSIAPRAALSLGVALLLAFAGGLLLNLMPCVFPILALKLLGLAEGARARHALEFLAGVLVTFGALAAVMLGVRAAGESIGWGFQLQSPWFVTALAVLFFVLALNLSGAFESGFGVQSSAAAAASRWRGPFADGVLAVAVASPCTAPFMGAAIGFTLAEPAPTVFAVFAALALGMALPYCLLVLNRGWARRLPRPGPWLETLRQFLAFPLYTTALWLAWVLGELAGLDAIVRLGVLLLAIAFAIRLGRGAFRFATSAVLIAAAIAWLHLALTPAPAQATWQVWSPQAFAAARGAGKPVFIDFTAAWCVTCQVNKHAVLNTAEIERALERTGTVALRADWTRHDPDITRALAALGRNGVPVYAVYDKSGRVQLLPEILTTARVLEALGEAK